MNIRAKLLFLVIAACFMPVFGPAYGIVGDRETLSVSGCSDTDNMWRVGALPEYLNTTGCATPYQYDTCRNTFGRNLKLDKDIMHCTSCRSNKYHLEEMTVTVTSDGTAYDIKVQVCTLGCGVGSYGECYNNNVAINPSICCSACPTGGKSYIGKNGAITDCFIESGSDNTGIYIYTGTGANYNGTECNYTN